MGIALYSQPKRKRHQPHHIEVGSKKTLGNEPLEKKRNITIISNLTDECFTYQHWSGNHRADEIDVSAGSEKLFPKRNVTCVAVDDKVTIQYKCSFAKGVYKSTKEVTFKLDPHQTTYKLDFSWDDPQRLRLTSAVVMASR